MLRNGDSSACSEKKPLISTSSSKYDPRSSQLNIFGYLQTFFLVIYVIVCTIALNYTYLTKFPSFLDIDLTTVNLQSQNGERSPIFFRIRPVLEDASKILSNLWKNVEPPVIPNPKFWIDNTENWKTLINHAKTEPIESISQVKSLLNLDSSPAPQNNHLESQQHSSRLGCIVFLLGSHQRFEEELKVALRDFSRNYLQYYNYPVFVFHFGISRTRKNEYLSIARRYGLELELIEMRHAEIVPQLAQNASRFSTDPVGKPMPAASWNPEYKFQNQFFVKTMFLHEKLKDFKFIWRIDTDIQLVYPANIDYFEVMNSNNLQFSFHHWGYEPKIYKFVTHLLAEMSEFFVESSPNAFFPSSSSKNRNSDPIEQLKNVPDVARAEALKRLRTVDNLFSGGGCFSITSTAFMRKYSTQKYIDFITNSGGIWTHRWADQSILPRIVAIFSENPHNSTYFFSNTEILHKGELYPPHKMLPPWPLAGKSYDKSISERNKQRIAEFSNGLRNLPKVAIIYFINSKDEVEFLLKSLKNLKENLLLPMKLRNQRNLDVFIFYQEEKFNILKEFPNINILIKKQLTSEYFFTLKSIPKEPMINKNSFLNYYMFKFKNELFATPNSKNYEYFMIISPFSNIVAPLNFNIFEVFAKFDLYLGYHRWWSPEQVIITQNYEKIMLQFDPNLIKMARNSNPTIFGSPNNKIPVEFCYFDYLLLGSFEFFLSKDYISTTEKVLSIASNSNSILNNISPGCWFLQSMALRPTESAAKVFHLSQIYLNFRSDENAIPFQPLNGWSKDVIDTHSPLPPFPVVYKSYSKIK